MPHQVGVTGNNSAIDQDLLPTTIGNVLGQAGYDAALAGKWHVRGCEPPGLWAGVAVSDGRCAGADRVGGLHERGA